MPDPVPIENPVIVQFMHPGGEYTVRGATRKHPVHIPWVGGKTGARCGHTTIRHTRRFVSHEGDYVDDDGQLRVAQLGFWTEWEACSSAVAMPPSDDSQTAHWVHTVKSPLDPVNIGTMNTDPCVFGQTFKYCCCQQTNNGVMRRIAPGSLILFGSYISSQFFLDTVFVVGEPGTHYITGNTANLGVSPQYLELSLNRLENGHNLTFYRGKTFAKPGGEPYSFTPAKLFKEDDICCGKRFALDIDAVNRCLPENSRQLAPKLHQHFKRADAKPQTIVCVWKEIVRQVRQAGFVPGIRFDWPN